MMLFFDHQDISRLLFTSSSRLKKSWPPMLLEWQNWHNKWWGRRKLWSFVWLLYVGMLWNVCRQGKSSRNEKCFWSAARRSAVRRYRPPMLEKFQAKFSIGFSRNQVKWWWRRSEKGNNSHFPIFRNSYSKHFLTHCRTSVYFEYH